jgi:CheY-like chemotaxis protein
MPVMDGFEATKRLRLHEVENGVWEQGRQLIIGISANSGDSIEQSALASGMDAFIPVGEC